MRTALSPALVACPPACGRLRCWSGCLPTASAAEPAATKLEAYRLGVFPYVPVLTVDRIFGPVAAQFAEDLGRPVHLKTKSTFGRFAEELRKETYDIVLVHPFFYVEARDKHHYLPLARLDEPLTAMVMVREDDPIETLADLKGKKIGLPPALAAVSELVKASLLDAGLVPGIDVALEHYRSKPSCLQAVAIGRVAACGLPRFALSQIDPDNEFKLRLMFETAGHQQLRVRSASPGCRKPTASTSASRSWPGRSRPKVGSILAGGAWTPLRPRARQGLRRGPALSAAMQQFAQR